MDQAYIDIVRDGDSVTVIGGGSLDLTNYDEFHEGLRAAARDAESVTVDLRSADFIDTAVVQDLARAAIALMDRGKRLRVMASQTRYPLRVLKISGFQTIMDIEVESGEADSNASG